jgi:hypothetical protein
VKHAIGISIHTGWGACVVVGGSLAKPEIVVSEVVEVLGDSERFCFHMAAEMKRAEVDKWIQSLRKKALANAKRALSPLLGKSVSVAAIVAKPGEAGDLDQILLSHPRLHTAEGCFYRDLFKEACGVPVHVISPSSLDVSKVGKLAGPPWGKDQKLAALAAWNVMKS